MRLTQLLNALAEGLSATRGRCQAEMTPDDYRKIALSSTQLFVASVAGAPGRVDVYTLPITAASVPAFSMTNVNTPEAMAMDSSGNLYVGNLTDATIRVFAPPFSASSTPTTTLTLTGTFALFGIAVGK